MQVCLIWGLQFSKLLLLKVSVVDLGQQLLPCVIDVAAGKMAFTGNVLLRLQTRRRLRGQMERSTGLHGSNLRGILAPASF